MFGFGKKKKTVETIEVRFTENNGNEPFAVTDMPLDELPDEFEINTEINIDGELWAILGADPLKKTEIVEKGVLDLNLSKVDNSEETDDSEEDVIYSIPSVNDEVGLMTEFMQDIDNYFPVTEDYWRQIELVCDSYDDEIDEELNKILDIHNSRVEAGFKEIYIRKLITEPLKNSEISLSLLKDHFGVSKEYKGVIYDGQPFGIENSYAFVSEEGVIFWGEYDENENAKSICVHFTKTEDVTKFSNSLSEFLTESDLYFVDWCRVQKLYDGEGLSEYYEEFKR